MSLYGLVYAPFSPTKSYHHFSCPLGIADNPTSCTWTNCRRTETAGRKSPQTNRSASGKHPSGILKRGVGCNNRTVSKCNSAAVPRADKKFISRSQRRNNRRRSVLASEILASGRRFHLSNHHRLLRRRDRRSVAAVASKATYCKHGLASDDGSRRRWPEDTRGSHGLMRGGAIAGITPFFY